MGIPILVGRHIYIEPPPTHPTPVGKSTGTKSHNKTRAVPPVRLNVSTFLLSMTLNMCIISINLYIYIRIYILMSHLLPVYGKASQLSVVFGLAFFNRFHRIIHAPHHIFSLVMNVCALRVNACKNSSRYSVAFILDGRFYIGVKQ